jgi:hypothetical protein
MKNGRSGVRRSSSIPAPGDVAAVGPRARPRRHPEPETSRGVVDRVVGQAQCEPSIAVGDTLGDRPAERRRRRDRGVDDRDQLDVAIVAQRRDPVRRPPPRVGATRRRDEPELLMEPRPNRVQVVHRVDDVVDTERHPSDPRFM